MTSSLRAAAGAVHSQIASESDLGLLEPERILDQARAENFPVALRVLPREVRRHLLAIYGFARLADDLGDEAPGDRLAQLDWLEADLDRAYAGNPEHPLLQRLAPTLAALDLPREPFLDLIDANRQDQRIRRYASYTELEQYCQLSATPVGRLVLQVFGVATPERLAFSDAVCTGLQLVEHCQDVAEDLARDRIYLPAEDLARFGCREPDLRASSAGPALRDLLCFQMDRVRGLLEAGERLIGTLGGWPRLAVTGFTAGGYAAVDSIRRCDFDVLRESPRTRRRDVLRHALRLLWIGRRPSGAGHE
jgi:squalene synthase HpnC